MQNNIKRTAYTNELIKWIDKPQVKVLTGIRRCGKSTVLALFKAELLAQGKSGKNAEIDPLSSE
jgi:predicted AAA+ superfamily ATPase